MGLGFLSKGSQVPLPALRWDAHSQRCELSSLVVVTATTPIDWAAQPRQCVQQYHPRSRSWGPRTSVHARRTEPRPARRSWKSLRYQALRDITGHGTPENDPHPMFLCLPGHADVVVPVTRVLVHKAVSNGTPKPRSLSPSLSRVSGVTHLVGWPIAALHMLDTGLSTSQKPTRSTPGAWRTHVSRLRATND